MTSTINQTETPVFTHTRECRTWALGMAVRAATDEAGWWATTGTVTLTTVTPSTMTLSWLQNYADGLQESGVCSCAQLALVHAEDELRLARKAAKSWQLKWPDDELHSANLAHRVKQLVERRNAIKKEL